MNKDSTLTLDAQEGVFMAQYVMIQRQEMVNFLESKGFKLLWFEGVSEMTYGKRVRHDLTLRVYTSIVNGGAREVGADAIRCVLMYRSEDGKISPIGKSRRVHRVEGWKKNLEARINDWEQALGPDCPKCSAPTVERKGKHGTFDGCVRYPDCK